MRALSSTLWLLGLCIGLAPSLRATTSFNFSSSTQNAGVGSIGNSLTFTPGAAFTVFASAWSTTGASNALAPAALGQYYSSTIPFGLGVCASTDYSGSPSRCTSPQHAIDNVGSIDFVLLTFSQPLYSASFTLDVFNSISPGHDTDVTYFAGECPLVNGCSPSGLTVTGGSPTLNNSVFGANSASFVTASPLGPTLTGTATTLVSIDLNADHPVNWILIGASTNGSANDYFKINGMTFSDVPEPATFGMAGVALLGLGLLRARKKRSADV